MKYKKSLIQCFEEPDEYNGFFSKRDLYLASHDSKGKSIPEKSMSCSMRRLLNYDNMKLLVGTKFSLPVDMSIRFPEVKPYNGSIEFDMKPFSKRKKYLGRNVGIHFFEYDNLFDGQLTKNMDKVTVELLQVPLVIAPDYSLIVGSDDVMFNLRSKWKSMLYTNHFQRCGINVVPVATWGDANSLKWAFAGLPLHSIIAVSGVGHERHIGSKLLWNTAVLELEKQLQPTLILVYGHETIIPGLQTPLKFITDHITRKFRK